MIQEKKYSKINKKFKNLYFNIQRNYLLRVTQPNIPTIIFWNPNHWELKKEVEPYFELLKSVGVFHETPESAAQKMIDVWNDISSWWHSKKLQTARQKFCKQFSRNNCTLAEDLKKKYLKIKF